MTADGPLVVIGDSLLDVDLDGITERECPDAPAPVVDLRRRQRRPGGAALAALLAARSGSSVQLITAIARDDAADTLLDLLDEVEVVPQPMRGTTPTKTRIRVGSRPLARVDSGTGTAAAGPLTDAAREAVQRAGALLVCDYGRDMTWHPELRFLLAGRAAHVPLLWDPHPRGAPPVAAATAVTPNLAEAEQVTGRSPHEHARGVELCRQWRAEAAIVTVGGRGAVLTHAGSSTSRHIPVPADLTVSADQDTCGAGDRFAGAVAEALRQGQSLAAAVEEAVAEAAVFVRTGAAAGHSTTAGEDGPVVPGSTATADLQTLISRTRRAGGRIVATGGCFDILHRGHVTLLDRARELGDLLVVCLNSDDSVRRAKGPGRPVVSGIDRARVLTSLASVDAVALFDEDTPTALLDRLRPDIWVKGHDYTDRPLPEAEVVVRHGGRVVLLPFVDGYSSTRLLGNALRSVPLPA